MAECFGPPGYDGVEGIPLPLLTRSQQNPRKLSIWLASGICPVQRQWSSLPLAEVHYAFVGRLCFKSHRKICPLIQYIFIPFPGMKTGKLPAGKACLSQSLTCLFWRCQRQPSLESLLPRGTETVSENQGSPNVWDPPPPVLCCSLIALNCHPACLSSLADSVTSTGLSATSLNRTLRLPNPAQDLLTCFCSRWLYLMHKQDVFRRTSWGDHRRIKKREFVSLTCSCLYILDILSGLAENEIWSYCALWGFLCNFQIIF